jgi:hypothetical protein
LQKKKTKKPKDKPVVASLSQPSAITKKVGTVANVASSQPASVVASVLSNTDGSQKKVYKVFVIFLILIHY